MNRHSIRSLSHGTATTLVMALLLPSAYALAQTPPGAKDAKGHYQKKETEIKAEQSKLTKPEAPPAQPKKTGPVLTIDQFIDTKKAEIQRIVDQQINQMRKMIAVTGDDDPQKPDFYFRLGELHAEKQRFFFGKARALDQKIFEAQPGQKPKLQDEQKKYEKAEEQWLLEAVKSYVSATKFRKYDRMDEVLFKLAYLLTTVKKEEEARNFFHRLIKDYPNSKYIPDAYLSFAEYFFGKGEIDAALKFYEKVEQFPKSSVYAYAVYKKGWCYINLGGYKQALETFVGVVRMTQEPGKLTTNKLQKQALEKEAKKDIVKAYSHVGGADKAFEFFQRTGGDYAPKMMESLAEMYWEQGQFGESSKTFRKIISMNMESPRICEWQNKIVRNTLSAGNKRDQVQEIQRLGAAYDTVAKMQNVKKDVIEECKIAYHDTSKELALIWHKEAQKTKNQDTYALVQFVYKEFLEHFPSDKDAYDMSFYYGELLWTLERWTPAAEQYTKVVEMDPKGKYAKEAAYAAVLGWKNALNMDDEGLAKDAAQAASQKKGEDPKKKFEERAIPENQRKMIAAFDTYIKYVPDSPELVKIKYRKARVYYEYNHFKDAAALFQDLVEKHTKDELAIYSANLLLDCFNALGKTKEIIAYVDKFMQMPELMKDKDFANQMFSLKSDTYDVEAREFEKKKNFKECGRSFLAAAESMPEQTGEKHAERLWNAATCFQNGRLVGQALKLRIQLVKDHPKNERAHLAMFRIAAGYHQLAAYSKAAENYEVFASKYSDKEKAVEALGNATAFRLGLGEDDKAIEDMNSFIKFYGTRKPQDAAGVFFQMGEVFEKQKRTDELMKHLAAYLSKWGTHGGPDRQIVAHFKMGEILWKASCAHPQPDGACYEVKRVSASGRARVIAEMKKKLGRAQARKIKEKDVRVQCGPPTKSKITVLDRDKNRVKEAQKHFDDAIRIFAKGSALTHVTGKDVDARKALAAYDAAGAVFYKAEQLYEDFLRIKFPEGLDFSKPSSYDSKKKQDATKKKLEESTKKFMSYIGDKGKSLDKARNAYLDALTFKQANWAIAAAARVGQVYQDFAGQLYTATIPSDLKEQDEWGNRPRDLYCDALEDQAEPVEGKAVDGFEKCLKAAMEFSWYNEWSRLCERELNQMKPAEYPLASEIKPEPGYTATVMAPAAVIDELTGASVAAAQ